MLEITIEERQLASQERSRAVSNISTPILADRGKVEVRRIGIGRNSYTLGVLPRGFDAAAIRNPEEPRVPTRVEKLFVNYYEVWLPDTLSSNFRLERAYMHLHVSYGREAGDRRILSLHCDPALSPKADHYRYKRGPHLHIDGAEPRLDRAHIPLCLSDPDLGGKTALTLTGSLKAAVEMIKSQLLPCWERGIRR